MTAASELLVSILSVWNIPWASVAVALAAVGFVLGSSRRPSRGSLAFASLAVAQRLALLAVWILVFRFDVLSWAAEGPPTHAGS